MRLSFGSLVAVTIDTILWSMLIAAIFAFVACASVDKALLKPEVDASTKQRVMVNPETGDKRLESEVKQMAPEEAKKYEPSYIGPKSKADWDASGFDGNIAGVSVGGALALAAAAWWAIRRRRFVKAKEVKA